MIVPDAPRDPRFVDTDLVTGAGIRFYAGAPLITHDGVPLGSFSLLDMAPNDGFTAATDRNSRPNYLCRRGTAPSVPAHSSRTFPNAARARNGSVTSPITTT